MHSTLIHGSEERGPRQRTLEAGLGPPPSQGSSVLQPTREKAGVAVRPGSVVQQQEKQLLIFPGVPGGLPPACLFPPFPLPAAA